jgi:hypothetical protein
MSSDGIRSDRAYSDDNGVAEGSDYLSSDDGRSGVALNVGSDGSVDGGDYMSDDDDGVNQQIHVEKKA